MYCVRCKCVSALILCMQVCERSARACECMDIPASWIPASLCLQLRVIRAFKSTLEDLEERRSVHSLHSLHSLRSSRSHTGPWPPRPLSDITYIDEDSSATKISPQSAQAHNSSLPLKNEGAGDHAGASNRLLSPYSAYYLPPSQLALSPVTASNRPPHELLSRPVHETRI